MFVSKLGKQRVTLINVINSFIIPYLKLRKCNVNKSNVVISDDFAFSKSF